MLLFFTVGCASQVNVSKKDAIDTFVKRSEKLGADLGENAESKAGSSNLIQFTYGPDSLKDVNFLAYLVRAKANLTPDLVKQLREEENAYALLRDSKSFQMSIYKQKLLARQKEIDLYKRLTTSTTVSFSSIKLSQALTDLVARAGLKAEHNFTDSKLSGQFSGSLYDVLTEITQRNKLWISFSKDGAALVFSNTLLPGNPAVDSSLIKEVFLADKDQSVLSAMMAQLSKHNGQMEVAQYKKYMARLKTATAKKFVETTLYQIKDSDLTEAKNLKTSDLRKTLIHYAEATPLEGVDQTKTVAIFKPDLKSNGEGVVQKFNVYNDSPDNMLKILDNYAVFKLNCAKTPSSPSPAPTPPAASPPAASPTASPAPTASPVTPASASPAIVAPDCIVFSKDATGIVAAGSILDVQLIERFLGDQDRPIKQAMIEVFILEVNTDWQRTIQTKIAKNKTLVPATTDPAAPAATASFDSGFMSGVLNFPSIVTGMNIQALRGGSNDVGALINLIESNAAGRTISNPLILLKDGETGSVSKVRTVRKEIAAAPVISNGVVTPGVVEIKELTSPLKLDIKASINKHNDNIELDFNFTETVLDADTIVSPSTQNEIKSKLIAQPGQVIVMAGLFKEKDSKVREGWPGIPTMVHNLVGPLIALFGGTHAEQKTGSELLVFINPSVITNRNMDKTMNRARY